MLSTDRCEIWLLAVQYLLDLMNLLFFSFSFFFVFLNRKHYLQNLLLGAWVLKVSSIPYSVLFFGPLDKWAPPSSLPVNCLDISYLKTYITLLLD